MTFSARSAFLSGFVGRRDELREVRRLVEAHRLVTLIGVGGLGKTRLGYHVLDDLSAAYPGATWAVDLAELMEPALLADTFALSMGVPVPAVDPDPTFLVEHLGDRPALLYVDNCEHLLEECAQLIDALVSRCPGLHVLTSSRQALGVLGEHVYPLLSMNQGDAIQLFVDRAVSALPHWSLTDENRGSVEELCAAVDRVPLAIELTAVQIRAFTPKVMAERLREQGLMLSASARGELTRRNSLEACIRWSYDLCTDDEQRLWERLSVFAGGFSLDAVERACAGDLDVPRVLAALAGLVDKSVVERDAEDPDGRYRMLELIRQFGDAKLVAAGEREVWRRSHRDYYVAMAERFDADWIGPRQAVWMDRFRVDHANLRLAFDFSVADAAEAPEVMRMCTVLEHYFASHGGGAEAVHWLRLALAHGTGTPLQRASALRVGCFIAVLLADLDTAAELHAQMLPLVEQTGDDLIRAYTSYAGAMLRTWQGDADEGARLADEAAGLLRELGDVSREANIHFLRGMMLGWADRPEDAAVAYQRCFDLTEPRQERWLTSYAAWGLGVDAIGVGALDEATRLEREALRAKVDFGDQLGIGLALEALAWVAAERGRGKEAAVLLGATDAIWATIGMTVAAMPYLSRRREIGTEKAQGLLSAAEFEQLLRHGREMAQLDAVHIALGQSSVDRTEPETVLTRREREIAEYLTIGSSNREIAERLVISVRTVETHVESILRKLGVDSRGKVAAALSAR